MRGHGIVHVADVLSDPTYELTQQARVMGFRCGLAVSLLRDEQVIGAIYVGRAKTGLFSAKQVELLQTFADQAVIAVENVRLFTELQTSNRELTTALDKQTATSDILSVISRSQTNIQPVFDAIVHSAVRLLGGHTGGLTRVEGDQIVLVALTSVDASADAAVRATFPDSLQSANPHARAVRERMPLNIADAHTDSRLSEATRAYSRTRRFQSWALVPLLRQAEAIGGIGVTRRAPGGFRDDEIALLKTFADQAVIAIENVRLFTELQEKNRALTTAHAQVTETLEQQTATAEILRVIAASPTDIQSVLDSVAESAGRLCEASDTQVYRLDADELRLVAHYGAIPTGPVGEFTVPVIPGVVSGRTVLERRIVHLADLQLEENEFPVGSQLARRFGYRASLSVPLMREGRPLGAIHLRRTEARLFTERQIALLQTFADQAAIAIENVRLFTDLQTRTQELTRSVDKLTALGEVGRAVSSTLDLDTVLSTIVSRAIQLSGTDGGSVYEYDEATEEFSLRASRDLPEAYVEQVRDGRPRKGEGAVGRVAQTREPVQIADISDPAAYESRVRRTLLQIGLRALLAVPLIAEDELVGALIVMRKRTGTFAAEEVALLQTFATQSALAIQNARLFREIEEKSRQLEAASQHKSEFLANMSHELRTPLNAIIGFSEVLSEKMFGELNDKQEEYSKDIHASGQHLLSLINDILDLSKIEAGRMELELTEFDLPTALENALMLVRERAQRRSLTLHKEVDAGLGQIQGDERKIRQVVLNLLSNAIKFTPEGGRIELAAAPKDGCMEVSVTDTGVGIAPEDQERVFEEFRQVGTAEKKAEGTGLGLTLCRKFIELHGGKIWVKSQLGQGATFTFTIPVRRRGE
jgi:two-component system, NtrC family, sensor kinase